MTEFIRENPVILVLIALNLLSFSLMGIDKALAIFGQRRISERALLGVAFCFASVGAFSGLLAFRHKSRKLKFRWGLPAMILLHLLIAYMVYRVFLI